VERKPDDRAIGAFFDELAGQPWLGYRRAHWPRFFFHITGVQNASSILTDGRIYCRRQAVTAQRMVVDNASADILDQSSPWITEYVRLYFRPRTPTFYRNEGIRPPTYRKLGAHCPVPVALLFDAKEIAGRAGVRFSDGNLASAAARHGDDAAFLRTLNFPEIYHVGPIGPVDRSRITSRRQAEITVPGELGLEALRLVAARSPAERLTLLTLLKQQQGSTIVQPDMVIVEPSLFFCEWTYIEEVTLASDTVRLLFNPYSETPGPFSAEIDWIDSASGTSMTTTGSMRCLGHVTVPVPDRFRGRPVHVTVRLDRALAFSGPLAPVPSATLIPPARRWSG
jgi:hypothetical protein